MSVWGADDVGFLLVDGRDVLGDTVDIEDDQAAPVEETTPLGQDEEEYKPIGVKSYTLTQNGFFNDAANKSNALLVEPGVSRVLCFAPRGNTLGAKFAGSPLVQVNYKRLISRGALHKANVSYQSAGQHDEGIILHTHKAETAASGSTEGADSQDNTDPTTNGVGYLQVSALTLGGYTSVTIKIRDSDDDVTYVDLIAFTNITAAPTAERSAVSGTINRHLAHSWLFNGAGTGMSITYFVGFSRS